MSVRFLAAGSALSLAFLSSSAFASGTDPFGLVAAPPGAQLRAMADATPMRVIVTLPLQDEAGARRYGAAVSDPDSPLYGDYLTPAQFGDRFGADRASYEALRNWGRAMGLSVGPRLDSRAEISFGGTAGQFAAIFGTHFLSFLNAHGGGYTVTNPPRLPALLQGRVDTVVGLSSGGRLGLLPRHVIRHTDVGSGIGGSGYAPADLWIAYDNPRQRHARRTEIVALFEQGGYNPSDFLQYTENYNLGQIPSTQISVNGSPVGELNDTELESNLDLDMLAAGNPSIKQILVYEDSYNNDSFQIAILDAINQVAQDAKASVFSISYGQVELVQGQSAVLAEGKALIQLQTQGVTVLASSGDLGAIPFGSSLNVSDPGAQRLVTSVGGTDLTTDSNTRNYISEVVWNGPDGASGGGPSLYWKIPTWQLVNGVSVAAPNGGSSTSRNVPDVAAVGDGINSPVSVYCADYGGYIGVGGTSASAPIWASWITVFNSDRVARGRPRIGFANPLIYKVARQSPAVFHDITSGNNILIGQTQGYTAGPGYDNCTGWGSLDVGWAIKPFTR